MKLKPVNLDDITISFGDREVKPIAYEVSANSSFNTAKVTFTVYLNELMQDTCKVEATTDKATDDAYQVGYAKGKKDAFEEIERLGYISFKTNEPITKELWEKYQSEGTCKVENRPSDEGKTDKGLDGLWDTVTRFQGYLCQLEKKVEGLEKC